MNLQPLLDFLSDLKENNRKEWMDEHRQPLVNYLNATVE